MSTARPNFETVKSAPLGAVVTFERHGHRYAGRLAGVHQEAGYWYAKVIWQHPTAGEVRDLVFHADLVAVTATDAPLTNLDGVAFGPCSAEGCPATGYYASHRGRLCSGCWAENVAAHMADPAAAHDQGVDYADYLDGLSPAEVAAEVSSLKGGRI